MAMRVAVVAALSAMLTTVAAATPATATEEQSERSVIGAVQNTTAPLLDATAAATSAVWQDSVRLRGELGFSTSPAALAKALPAGVMQTDDEGLYDLVNHWGFIGTPAEAAEMARRDALVKALMPTLDKWAAQTGYAGHFLDNARGGIFVIQFTGSIPDQAAAELSKHLPGDSTLANIELRQVRFTSGELTAALRAVWASNPKHVVAVGEDVTTNGLDITLSPEATEKDRAAILSLTSVPVAFDAGTGQDETCTSRNQCNTPQRGGVGIEVGSATCSSGWVVNRGSTSGILTAGHCWWGSTSGSVTSGSAGTFGSKTSLHSMHQYTHADMRYLSGSAAWAYLYEDDTDKKRVVTGSDLGVVGQTACLYGRNSATPRCGTIQSTNTSHVSSTTGFTIYGQSSATYSSSGGDSGGAVATGTVGNTARGVHAGLYGSVKHYSWIGYSSTYDLGTLRTG